MDPTEERFIDKSDWGPGPWQDEPDRIEWRWLGTPRFPCLIVRNRSGALCGYVGVPEGHPYFGANGSSGEPAELHVHGGITYGAPCQEDGGKICHVARAGESDRVWWLGFDCAHAQDFVPAHEAAYRRARIPSGFGLGETYKSIDYVRAEVESLAEQLSRVAKGEVLP
jgi:hypothetical protein